MSSECMLMSQSGFEKPNQQDYIPISRNPISDELDKNHNSIQHTHTYTPL